MNFFKHIVLAAAAGAAGLFAASLPSLAAGFHARPVIIETQGGNVASITVTNPGDRKIYLQNTVHEWRQDPSGQDVLTEASAAIVSPPGMWIQPGATYNLRIQLPPANDRELAFRVILQQLPDKSEIQARRLVSPGAPPLPAVAEPAQPTPAMLRARLVDPRHLLISNDGGRRARPPGVQADGELVGAGAGGYGGDAFG